ncbi:hypothetical protein GCK72_022140 [Caenorhabditis remanei]|uniref:Uncharacterized protein n=1 Tax=Caenorhabditis remanei TaxID=31234 RepID=A0A6A5FT15_CAERE|nr:hypothetical protein GCK72_022140 [Caenorhabditis remanei]KAF1745693.1 hypothetical protein GCK72_022140 [Caenorhabditis remanei]
MDPPPDFDEKMSVQSTKLFLAIGTTQREVLVQKFHSPRVDTIQPDKTIMELIDSGYGSFLLKELHSFYPSAATEKNGVVLFAMLCGFVFASREEKNRMETEYLDALRVATTPLFESLVHSPRMFRVFLAATKNMSISYDHSDLISSWYLKKSDEKLAYMFHFWRYGIMPHDEVWKTCKWMLTDSAFEEMANKIKNIEEHGLVDYPHLESLSGIIGDESIIRGLSNFAIAYSLTRSDRVCIRNCLGNPHYIRKTSAVEILHIRRSYESYTFFSPDIYLCNQLMNAYTDICNSDGDIAIKVLVVSMIRQGVTDEETHETSTAVLEDLMRNREAKMFAELPHTWDSQGFYSKRDGVLGKLGQVESQENDWHKIMGAAMNTKTFFECFVVVCSYFSNLTFGDILGSFESYKALVNPCAKLIVVAMNYQECTFEVGTRRDILFVNGVGELTMYQVVNFMSFQL